MAETPALMATYWTLAGDVLPLSRNVASPVGLRERAEAAASIGWTGMGLQTDDLDRAVHSHGFSGVRNILADNGIKFLELEALLDWFTDGERRLASDAQRHKLMTAAEALGAYQIKIAGDLAGGSWPLDLVTKEFSQLCRQAADAGTQISLEVFAGSNIADLPTAMAIVEGATASNGGLLLDIWHFARGGIRYEDIASIPTQYIKHVELNDADAVQVDTIIEDTIRRRKLPGEGDFDVVRFLRAVNAAGYKGLYGVEIVSDEHRRMPFHAAARRAFDATMAQFDKLNQQ